MKGATVEEPLMRLASLLARGGVRRRRVFVTVFKKMFRSFIIIIFFLFCSINGRLKRGKNKQIDNLFSDFNSEIQDCTLHSLRSCHLLV